MAEKTLEEMRQAVARSGKRWQPRPGSRARPGSGAAVRRLQDPHGTDHCSQCGFAH